MHQKLKTLRLIKGIKQETLAAELGITQAAYSKLENGQTDISISRLEQLSQIFQLPIENLISSDVNTLLLLVMEKQ